MNEMKDRLSPGGYEALLELVAYGRQREFFADRDITYMHNRLLGKFGVVHCPKPATGESCLMATRKVEDILEDLLVEAEELELIPRGSIASRDLFDTELIGVMLPRPSEVCDRFHNLAANDAEAATDYFYQLCIDSNYIREQRIAKDLRWQIDSEYGTIDISVNRSKPEKDPRAIAAAGRMSSDKYPKCLLCAENEGYRGSLTHPARSNLRVIDLSLQGEQWYLQYSPYVYYNEHCIFLHGDHHPMKIDRACFDKLLAIIQHLPHYFVGSNADLPIVGGSILAHEHFQGGHYQFAMEKSEIEEFIKLPGFEDVELGWVKWPMSVLRLRGANSERVSALADLIFKSWSDYSDPELGILATSAGDRHHTVTPIARRRGQDFELDLVLRDNRTDELHPWGIFHPREEYHHIKKENIGLIEVMGLAVLPARLAVELERIAYYLENEQSDLAHKLQGDPLTANHASWVEDLLKEDKLSGEVRQQLRCAVGEVFVKVLEDAGVYKRNQEGFAGRRRFIGQLIK